MLSLSSCAIDSLPCEFRPGSVKLQIKKYINTHESGNRTEETLIWSDFPLPRQLAALSISSSPVRNNYYKLAITSRNFLIPYRGKITALLGFKFKFKQNVVCHLHSDVETTDSNKRTWTHVDGDTNFYLLN